MSKCGSNHETDNGNGAVCVAFTGENQLTQGTSAKQNTAVSGQEHAQEVPEAVCMGNCLSFHAQLEKGSSAGCGENQVACQSSCKNRDKSQKQTRFFEQYHITDAAYHAETGSLSQSAYNQACSQADCNGSVAASRTAASFCKMNEGWSGNQKNQKGRFYGRENHSLCFGKPVGSL